MKRMLKHRVIQILAWSFFGKLLIKLVSKIAPRWNYVVLNRSLASEVNGEYWLINLLPPRPFILDVGFNRGDFTANVIEKRPDAKCIGFEPARSMIDLFHSNQNSVNIELINAAVSSHDGKCEFQDTSGGESRLMSGIDDKASTYSVDVITLDSFCMGRGIRHIDFLKIDVEGYDLHVLEGSSGILSQSTVDIFMFEYNSPWIDSKRFLSEACQFIATKPYRLFSLYNGFLVPFSYSHKHERYDLGCNYVGISESRLAKGGVPVKSSLF